MAARVVVLPELTQWRDEVGGEICVCLRTDATPAAAYAAMRNVTAELLIALSEPELSFAVPLPKGAGHYVGHMRDDIPPAEAVHRQRAGIP